MVVATGFWSMVFSPKHLRSMLSSPQQLIQLVKHIGTLQLLEEASSVEPLRGSYENNLLFFIAANSMADRSGMWLFGIPSLLLVSSTYLLGVWYLAAATACFLLASAAAVHSTVKNRNATHVHEFMIIIRKWHETHPDECKDFCQRVTPQFIYVHQMMSALKLEPTTNKPEHCHQ